MTAVFAFAFGRKAVVVTDTLRVDPGGFFANRTVQKSYCWKNLIPFGGAGSGAFIQQVADLMSISENQYNASEVDFLRAFEEARKQVIAAIHSSSDPKKKAVAHGVVLAAVPALSAEAHILRLDFATGEVITCHGQFAAEGTRPSEFAEIARAVLSEWDETDLEANRLALACIADAVSLCPEDVGWPMDLRVAESGVSGSHMAFHLRLDPRMPKDFLFLHQG